MGKLLVASTLTEDPVLTRSVSLIVHQDDDQVIAVMLNRPMNPNPEALMEMLDEPDGDDPESGDNRVGHLAGQAEQTIAEVTPAVGMVHFGGPLSGARCCRSWI